MAAKKKLPQATLYFSLLEWTMLRRESDGTYQFRTWGFPPHTPDKRATLDTTIRHSVARAEPVKGSAPLNSLCGFERVKGCPTAYRLTPCPLTPALHYFHDICNFLFDVTQSDKYKFIQQEERGQYFTKAMS
jgi:hypothetical protein